jgi:lipid-A-disaccharide synthase
MIEVPHVAMPNLILGRAAVPEKLQDECRPDILAGELERLLADPQPQKQVLNDICVRLGLDEMRATGILPSDRAARVVLEAIRARREPDA